MAAIDLTHRILQNTPPPAAKKSLRWHPWRRLLQVLCGVLFVALPLTNGLRLDVRQGVFFFGWHRMAAHDLLLLFWIAILGVWGLVAVSFLYGRLWCGWVCPQTLASDFADSLRQRLDRAFRTRPGRPRFLLARSLWTLLLCAMALGTGMTLASYWFAPHDVWAGTLAPLSDLAVAATVYGLAAVVAADMLWVRRSFCSDACPYGALIGLLADKNTLAVRFLDERQDDCIQCGKCVTDCPMGIDIKQGVGQLACIGCGECVDACNDVLGRRGVAGLIEYRYGTEPERVMPALTTAQRWGFWNAQRIAVVAMLVACAGMVGYLIFGQTPLSATINANGAIVRDAVSVSNTYTVNIVNGTPETHSYEIAMTGLPGGTVQSTSRAVTVGGHQDQAFPVTVSVPSVAARLGRTPIQLTIRSGAERVTQATIFYCPGN